MQIIYAIPISEWYSTWKDLGAALFVVGVFFPPFFTQEIPGALRKKHLGLIQFPGS